MSLHPNGMPAGVQHDMFPVSIPAESLHSTRLRTHEVIGDAMSPTPRPGDFVLALPTDRWHGDGLYLVDFGRGINIYRCGSDFNGGVEVGFDNPACTSYTIRIEKFLDSVVGFVLADIKVRAHFTLRDVMMGKT